MNTKILIQDYFFPNKPPTNEFTGPEFGTIFDKVLTTEPTTGKDAGAELFADDGIVFVFAGVTGQSVLITVLSVV